MAARKRYLTATMADGTVKTIGPTGFAFTHYWRIVAVRDDGTTEVFWGHAKSLKDAVAKRAMAKAATQRRGWASHQFEIAELVETESPASAPPRRTSARGRSR